MATYIGRYEINEVIEDGDMVKISFIEHDEVEMKRALMDILISDEPNQQADITSLTRHVLATKYLLDMSELGLDSMTVLQVSNGLGVLVENLIEQAIGEKFGCTGSNDIPLESIVNNIK